jgi:hypothetical protein
VLMQQSAPDLDSLMGLCKPACYLELCTVKEEGVGNQVVGAGVVVQLCNATQSQEGS